MRIVKVKDYGEMSRRAADFIAAQVSLKPNCVLGLATGSTPLGVYRVLIEEHRKGNISFREVSTFNLDEYRGLDPNDPHSYHYYMRQNLFAHIDIMEENTHIPDGLTENWRGECKQYEAAIRDSGGIDLQLLGIGGNSHIGFNEPGTTLTAETHLIELAESTRQNNARHFAEGDTVPRQAITMGVKTILAARSILVIASGEEKAEVVRAAFEGPITTAVPASMLQLHHNVTLIADQDALRLLRDR